MAEQPVAARLEADMKDAMRAGQKERLAVIRRARAALTNAGIAARSGGGLDEDGAVRALRGLVKQHRESIEQFRAAGREDLAGKEEAEMAVLEAYLPAQLDEAAVAAVVAEVVAQTGASGPTDMGRVMKASMARLGGSADGKMVNAAVRAALGA